MPKAKDDQTSLRAPNWSPGHDFAGIACILMMTHAATVAAGTGVINDRVQVLIVADCFLYRISWIREHDLAKVPFMTLRFSRVQKKRQVLGLVCTHRTQTRDPLQSAPMHTINSSRSGLERRVTDPCKTTEKPLLPSSKTDYVTRCGAGHAMQAYLIVNILRIAMTSTKKTGGFNVEANRGFDFEARLWGAQPP